jgi:hypothetical protein
MWNSTCDIYNNTQKTKSYILYIKIRSLVTEYTLMIKLVNEKSSAHSLFNPYVYLGHSWSYFDYYGDNGTGYGDHMFHHLEHKRHHIRFRSHSGWLSYKYSLLYRKTARW